MKDIYIIMNRQNILNFYGSKLDLKLDSSELYDFELGKTTIDYNTDVLDLTNEITYTGLTIDANFNMTSNYLLYEDVTILRAENNNKIKKQN
jgi:hypothetical protein